MPPGYGKDDDESTNDDALGSSDSEEDLPFSVMV